MKKFNYKLVVSVIAATGLLLGSSLSAFASTAKVASNVRIRSEASTSGAVVASGVEGSEYQILEEKSGTDGYTWYKIQVDASTVGYVRGDLVKVQGDDGTTTTITTDNTENSATSLAPSEAEAINPITATIAGNAAVNVRSGAGTSYAKVAALEAGSSVTLVAKSNDETGTTWYQIKCEANGTEGFLRSDLLVLPADAVIEPYSENAPAGEDDENGEVTEAPTEEVQESGYTEEAEQVNYDYEIVYTADDSGVEQYYLYDHVNNTRQKVTDMLNAITELNKNYQEASSSLATYKILTIVFGGLAFILLILTIVFFFKSRSDDNEYYVDEDDDDEDEDYDEDEDDDEDDDDYEEDEDEEDDYEEEEVEEAPRKKANSSKADEEPVRKNAKASSAASTKATKAPVNLRGDRKARKSQNFLADDDDFEFEFLDMDDKD